MSTLECVEQSEVCSCAVRLFGSVKLLHYTWVSFTALVICMLLMI